MMTPPRVNSSRARACVTRNSWCRHNASYLCLWSSTFWYSHSKRFSPVDIRCSALIYRSALAIHCDHQSRSLLAAGAIGIVLTQLFAIAELINRHWECHGKPGETQDLLQCQSWPSNSFDPDNLKIEGATPLFLARGDFDVPSPYAAARWKVGFGSIPVFRFRVERCAKTQSWLRSALPIMSGVWWPRRADSPAAFWRAP
jgi:hypothetical protein